MVEKKVKIRNKAGIHCRPASVVLNAISSDFPEATFIIHKDGEPPMELNSILSLISLGLHYNDEALLQVEGPNAEEASEKIAALLENEFDFPPRE